MISVKGPRDSRSSLTNLCDTPNKGHRETLRYVQVTAVLCDTNFYQFFPGKYTGNFYLKA